MKKFSTALLMTVIAQMSWAGPFDGVTDETPVCFARTYSGAHLKKHKRQTVKTMDVKLSKRTEDNLNLLEVKVVRTNGKKYKTALGCNEDGSCWIDCDGGSAKITKNDQGLQLINNGFLMQGGCGEEEEIIFLESKPGGDDVFFLTPAECK